MNTRHPAQRRIRAVSCAALLGTALLVITARGAVLQSIPPVAERAAGHPFRFAIADPNAPQPAPAPAPAHRPAKKKAGFLAAAGLAILSLLVLATGLALLRAFRQR